MKRFGFLCLAALAVSLMGAAVSRASTPATGKPAPPAPLPVEFARDIQPLLAEKCYGCHGPRLQQGGLRLDRKADALRGGRSGLAIRSGQSAASRLIRYVAGLESIVMPPVGERLTAEQVGLLRAWIDQGAAWPEAASSSQTGHWAFQPLRRPRVPAVRDGRRVRSPIDAFVLARLGREKIRPSPDADRRTLIRRLSLDLLGLPPSPEEVEAFVQDTRPDAYERLVDRLLASPHFGERWGRHWLDLARYADSDGYEKDLPRPYAYLYRDWVINALNADMPFDHFTVEQIAGDLLPNATLEQKIATGFHRNTLTNREGGVDAEEFRVKAVVDRVNTTGTVWLGLTAACAQCHDHKFDPISQREYYSLFAFFNTEQEVDLPLRQAEADAYAKAKKAFDEERARLQAAVTDYEKRELPARQAEWEQRRQTTPAANTPAPADPLPPRVAEILAIAPEKRTPEQAAELTKYYRSIDPQLKKLQDAVAAHAKKAPTEPAKAATLADNPKPPATHVLIRGDFLRPGDEVSPRTPAMLQRLRPAAGPPNRLDLARWLVDPANPLTARVAVNRVWQSLFGRGLTNTPNDFGTRGEPPTHPELLDWLASEFMKPGDGSKPWSQKRLIRLIVTSATYRQASGMRPHLAERDPKNLLLARQSRFRVEAEIVRDLSLAAGGLLNPTVGGPSIRPPLPPDVAALSYASGLKWEETKGPERYKRGLYLHFQRTVPFPSLMTFDAPDGNGTCTRRDRSNTPLQALTLLNAPIFFECAQALGRRILAGNTDGTAARLRHAFRLCLARDPTPAELARLLKLYGDVSALYRRDPEAAAKLIGTAPPSGAGVPEAAAWIVLARTILNLDEFVTRE